MPLDISWLNVSVESINVNKFIHGVMQRIDPRENAKRHSTAPDVKRRQSGFLKNDEVCLGILPWQEQACRESTGGAVGEPEFAAVALRDVVGDRESEAKPAACAATT